MGGRQHVARAAPGAEVRCAGVRAAGAGAGLRPSPSPARRLVSARPPERIAGVPQGRRRLCRGCRRVVPEVRRPSRRGCGRPLREGRRDRRSRRVASRVATSVRCEDHRWRLFMRADWAFIDLSNTCTRIVAVLSYPGFTVDVFELLFERWSRPTVSGLKVGTTLNGGGRVRGVPSTQDRVRGPGLVGGSSSAASPTPGRRKRTRAGRSWWGSSTAGRHTETSDVQRSCLSEEV